jgi:hypothetical protein
MFILVEFSVYSETLHTIQSIVAASESQPSLVEDSSDPLDLSGVYISTDAHTDWATMYQRIFSTTRGIREVDTSWGPDFIVPVESLVIDDSGENISFFRFGEKVLGKVTANDNENLTVQVNTFNGQKSQNRTMTIQRTKNGLILERNSSYYYKKISGPKNYLELFHKYYQPRNVTDPQALGDSAFSAVIASFAHRILDALEQGKLDSSLTQAAGLWTWNGKWIYLNDRDSIKRLTRGLAKKLDVIGRQFEKNISIDSFQYVNSSLIPEEIKKAHIVEYDISTPSILDCLELFVETDENGSRLVGIM